MQKIVVDYTKLTEIAGTNLPKAQNDVTNGLNNLQNAIGDVATNWQDIGSDTFRTKASSTVKDLIGVAKYYEGLSTHMLKFIADCEKAESETKV